MKSQKELNEINKKLGWIPPTRKIFSKKEYKLWDAYYVKDINQMRAVEVMTLPKLKSEYSVRTIMRGDTFAVYVR